MASLKRPDSCSCGSDQLITRKARPMDSKTESSKTEGILVCEHCGDSGAKERRQFAPYFDMKKVAAYCNSCQEDLDKYWADLLEEYEINRR